MSPLPLSCKSLLSAHLQNFDGLQSSDFGLLSTHARVLFPTVKALPATVSWKGMRSRSVLLNQVILLLTIDPATAEPSTEQVLQNWKLSGPRTKYIFLLTLSPTFLFSYISPF